jgi:hypothetical protein
VEGSPYLPDPGDSVGSRLVHLLNRFAAGGVGLATTASSGSPELGLGAGVATDEVGKELIRKFAARPSDRAHRAILRAQRRIEERVAAGEPWRTDGEFEGGSSEDVFRIFETAVRAAMSSTEQRKADLVGSLLASAALDDSASVADILRMIRYIEDLSWRQVVALAYFADDKRAANRELLSAGGSEGTIRIRPGCEAELSELARTHELIGLRQQDDSVANPSNTMNGGQLTAASLSRVGPTGLGLTLHRLAEMGELITDDELDAFEGNELNA